MLWAVAYVFRVLRRLF
ncbi:hypothetical protein [Xylella fastidiosa]|nr:hypothetical protein [Xylella fastidiosa]MDD0943670.1 hypothetical protein [Xylella fastidiosa subsp. multiplex]